MPISLCRLLIERLAALLPGALLPAALLLVAGVLAGATIRPALAEVPQARLAVLARGINLAHWLRFPPRDDDEAIARYASDATLRSLRRAGFTYVRLPVGPEVVMQGSHIRPDRIRLILAIVRRIQATGLAVMIEPHPQLLQHWDLAHDEAARAALFGFWHDLAPRLKALPAALTFPELVNEPTIEAKLWDDLQRRLAARIRADLPDDTIILTGSDWGSLDGLLKVTPVDDPDVVYSFHSYEPALLTSLGFWDGRIDHRALAASIPYPVSKAACDTALHRIAQQHTRQVVQYWCSETHDEASFRSYLARATAWGRAHAVAVVLAEFGASSELNPTARDAYFVAVRRAADQLRLPWGVWALDDQMGFGLNGSAMRAGGPLPQQTLRDLDLPR